MCLKLNRRGHYLKVNFDLEKHLITFEFSSPKIAQHRAEGFCAPEARCLIYNVVIPTKILFQLDLL